MAFPFSIKRTLVLPQKDFNITSEGYLLHQIESYMESYRMRKKRSETEIFYMKANIFRSLRRKDYLQNVLFKVYTDQKQIKITIETEMILFLIFGFLAGIILFFTPGVPLLVCLLVPALFWGLGFGIKYFMINLVCSELFFELNKLSIKE